ncbi:MAG: DinB family protein [Anaerolineae bacterium]|nr:DinB family protein [Anaerolineae bacterium]
MTLDLIRDYYDYHFTVNRKIWDACITKLTNEQFLEAVDYGVGSIRDHVVHMMSVDNAWFGDLIGEKFVAHMDPEHYPSRGKIRETWDDVEQKIRGILASLDESLLAKPFPDSDEKFSHGQMLLHVVNHGTDHRAQLLRMLNEHGVETFPQDYIIFTLGRM